MSSTENKSSKKGLLIVSIILNVGLIGTVLYLTLGLLAEKDEKIEELYTIVKETKSDNAEKDGKIQAQETELEAILSKYKKIKAEREKLGEDNAELEKKIATIESLVSKYKNAYFKSEKERKNYETMLEDLNDDLAQMQEQIVVLKAERDSLSSENKVLQDEYANLDEENNYNSDQLSIARVLKAEKIAISAINSKGKELVKDDNEFKSRQTEKVKVNFRIGENKVAIHEKKEAFLRVIDPQNSVLFDLNKQGGSFTKVDGGQDFYTSKTTFDFKNSNQLVSFLYEQGKEFAEGRYKVEVYCEGHLIGRSFFIIK